MEQEDKKTLDERIDEQNKAHQAKNPEQMPGHTSLTTEQRPSETHNTISSPDGDSAGENKVWTSLDDE